MKSMKKTLSCLLALALTVTAAAVPVYADEEPAVNDAPAAVDEADAEKVIADPGDADTDTEEITETDDTEETPDIGDTADTDAEEDAPSEPVSDAKEYTEGGFTINEDGVVTWYEGTEVNLVIPEKIAGITVKSIRGNGYNSSMFSNASTLLTVSLPATLEKIDSYAFYKCVKLTRLTVPKNVTYIGDRAISKCAVLPTVDFEAGSKMKTIEHYSFAENNMLNYINIPDSVTHINYFAFYNCPKLTIVDFPESLEWIGLEAFESCTALKGCSKTMLDQIVIPDSCKTIDDLAFHDCHSIVSLTLGKSLELVGDRAFEDNYALTNITFLGGKTLGEHCFDDCTSLKSVVIPGVVKNIGNMCFSYSVNLESVIIQQGVETIGNYAFSHSSYDSYRCKKITSISLPNSLKSIGNGAFCYLSNLTSVTFGSGLETIGQYAFEGTGIKSLVLPDKLKTIDNSAFAKCTSLSSVHFGSKVHTINNAAFRGDSALTSVFLPDSVEILGEYSFADCTELRSFVTGKLMTALQNNTFYEDRKLTNVTFPNDISSIGNVCFKTTSSLTDIYYIGTLAEWKFFMAINPDSYLAQNVDNYIIHCIDGIYRKGTEISLSVSSVAISTTPAKTKYYVDDVADVEGGYIRVTFSDGSTVTVAMTTSMLVDFDTSTSGTKIVTVKYGEKTTSYTITVSEPEIESIYVSGFPTTANYGYELNLSSAVITITYSDGSSREAAVTANMVSGYNKDKLGAQIITVTYSGKTWSTTVTVKEITVASASLLSAPTKRSYQLGDALDATGGIILAIYTDGTSENIDVTTAMITGFNSSTAGTQTLTITYEGFVFTYNVTVFDPNALPYFSNVLVRISTKYYDCKDINQALKLAAKEGLDATVYVKKMEKAPALTFIDPVNKNTTVTINFLNQGYILTNSTTLNIKGNTVINCPIIHSNNKQISFKVGKNVSLTLNSADKYGTFSGSKGSKLSIGANITTDGIKTFDSVDSGSHNITFTAKGVLSAAPIGVAHLTFPLSLAKKIAVPDVTGMLTVTVSDTVTSGTQIFTYSGKTFLDPDKVVVTNKDGSAALKAFSYKKVVRAEIPDAMTLNGKECPTWEYALSQMTDAKTAYTISINKPLIYAKFALPAKAASLTINGLGNKIDTVKVKAITAKYEIILNNVTFKAGTNDVSLKSGKFDITLNNTTIGAVTTTGKLTLKGEVTANGAVSAAELCSSGMSDLTAQSLAVTKSGITEGSDTITLKLIDKNGTAVSPKPDKKGVITVSKKFKDSKTKAKEFDVPELKFNNNGTICSLKCVSGKLVVSA